MASEDLQIKSTGGDENGLVRRRRSATSSFRSADLGGGTPGADELDLLDKRSATVTPNLLLGSSSPPSRKHLASLSRTGTGGTSSTSRGMTVGSSSRGANTIISQLDELKMLYQEGHMDTEEYKDRKEQVINKSTGTSRTGTGKTNEDSRSRSVSSNMVSANVTRFNNSGLSQAIVVRPPPDFSQLPAENATKLTFQFDSKSWTEQRVSVKLHPHPFAKGGLRRCYYLQDLTLDHALTFAAKIAIKPNTSDSVYMRDVEMQTLCASYADAFNGLKPPRCIEFVQAWLLRLDDRGGLMCGVERYIPGDYVKHNNNFGHVSDTERNTPQAFSHFSFEASERQLLIVDIQGINDQYTDPQVHTMDGRGFGVGNRGIEGIEKFLANHRCNPICISLGLPTLVTDAGLKMDGTLPAARTLAAAAAAAPIEDDSGTRFKTAQWNVPADQRAARSGGGSSSSVPLPARSPAMIFEGGPGSDGADAPGVARSRSLANGAPGSKIGPPHRGGYGDLDAYAGDGLSRTLCCNIL